MTDIPEPTVRPTRYVVSCFPLDHEDSHFDLSVEYRGRNLWAVVRLSSCLGVDGTWSYGSIPSEREDEWLSSHRFDLVTALRLAKDAAPHITVNGYTIADALAMEASR